MTVKCPHLLPNLFCDLVHQVLLEFPAHPIPPSDQIKKPVARTCEVCTNDSRNSQAINQVIISLAIASVQTKEARRSILTKYGGFIRRIPKTNTAQITPTSSPEKRVGGPGTELHLIFKSAGFNPSEGCPCRSIAASMDRLGCQVCLDKIDHYTNAIRESAEMHGWVSRMLVSLTPDAAIKKLIRRAVQRARDKGTCVR